MSRQVEEHIASLIFSLSRAVRQESRRDEAEEHGGPSLVQLEVLKFIFEHGAPVMKSVADFLAIAPPSLTPFIDSLEERGLLERRPSQKDRRAISLVLTAKGKEALKRSFARKMKRLEDIFGRLTGSEQERLVIILEKLNAPEADHP